MAGQASSNVLMKFATSRAYGAHHLLNFVLNDQDVFFLLLLLLLFFSGRLNDLVSKFMEKPRDVNDWVGSRTEFSQFMAKPSCCKRSSIS